MGDVNSKILIKTNKLELIVFYFGVRGVFI